MVLAQQPACLLTERFSTKL